MKLVLADSMEQVLDSALRRRPKPITIPAPDKGSVERPQPPRRPEFPSEQPPVVV
jgi:hypothetical protein